MTKAIDTKPMVEVAQSAVDKLAIAAAKAQARANSLIERYRSLQDETTRIGFAKSADPKELMEHALDIKRRALSGLE